MNVDDGETVWLSVARIEGIPASLGGNGGDC